MEKFVSWKYATNYFKKCTEEGFELKLQLKLVKQIANSQYANYLYPSTSHFCLTLSGKKDYNKQINSPSISVCQIDEQSFEITYSPKQMQTHNISKRVLEQSEVWSYLESLFIKLKFDSENFESDK